MRILILGGTGFFGPHLVEALLANKHEVTLFNRGRTNPQLFPDLEKLQGNRNPARDNGLKALEGRTWDVCVDNSGYFPRFVKASAELLAKQGLKQYVFISSVSAYSEAAMAKGTVDETSAVGTLPEGTEVDKIDRVTGENYGPMKALCEQAAEAAMPGHATNIRPGLIVGPGDTTDRYTYWPVRVDRGGEVLAPDCPEVGVQYIDVRNLADWTVKLIQDGHVGVYNALGPKYKLTWTAFLYACKAVTTSDARFTGVDEQFLLDNNVGPWMELPLWIPSEGKTDVQRASNEKAVSVGLTFRPAAVTAMDTLNWAKAQRPQDREWGAGLKPEKEQQVLAAWHAKKGHSPATTPSAR